ncbi:DUF927 domain-containing protein [Salmonella enterica]|uniref:DUF927 domain-containing protein n=1 Tax=Salmonella enterica TaxID=28901 RepID=UPI00109D869B|nr:DUF927 domain-containing protein [Salmonella enterica]QCC10052.1 DUF927 domain-containing protein [Salmonella enterica subsp. enterica serovar Oranienburg]
MTTNKNDIYLIGDKEIELYDPDAVSEETEQEQEQEEEEQLQIEEDNSDNESENEEDYQEDDDYTEEEDEQNDEHQASTVIGTAQEADLLDPSNKLDGLPSPIRRKKKEKEITLYESFVGKITTHGMYHTSRKSVKGKVVVKDILVHNFPIFPVEIITALDGTIDESVTYIKFVFKSIDGEFKEVIIPSGAANDFKEVKKAGFLAPSPLNHSKVLALINDVISNGSLNKKTGYSQCGWTSDLMHHIRPDNDLYVGKKIKVTEVKGSADLYFSMLSEFTLNCPQMAFGLAFAAAGYMRGYITVTSLTPFYILYGKAHMGKSKTCQLIASLQGNPMKGKGNNIDSNTTMVGFHKFLANNNHGVLVVDELDNIFLRNNVVGATLIMDISNGGGRAHSDQYRNTYQGESWNNSVIASTNLRIEDVAGGTMKEQALFTRLMQIDVEDSVLHNYTGGQYRLEQLSQIMSENYGHFYPKAIEKIKAKGKEYKARLDELLKELTTDIKLVDLQNEPRSLEMLALAQVGAELVGDVLGEKEGAACQAAVDIIIERFKRSEDELISKKQNEDANTYEMLKSFITDNAQRFRWENYAYCQGNRLDMKKSQIDQAIEFSSNATKASTGALGVVVQESVMDHALDYNGYVLLNPSAFDSLARYGISKDKMISAAKNLGMLREQGGKNTKKLSDKYKAMLSGLSRAYKIELKDISDILEFEVPEVAPEENLKEITPVKESDFTTEHLPENENGQLSPEIEQQLDKIMEDYDKFGFTDWDNIGASIQNKTNKGE